jgi:hypothetical protein
VINAFEGSVCFHIFILHNSMCQVPCGSCKNLPRSSVLTYFSGPSGLLMPALCVEKCEPLQPVLGCVRDVALIHNPSCTDSIKPSLQFSCNFVVINASEGSLCFQIFSLCLFLLVEYVWKLSINGQIRNNINMTRQILLCVFRRWIALVTLLFKMIYLCLYILFFYLWHFFYIFCIDINFMRLFYSHLLQKCGKTLFHVHFNKPFWKCHPDIKTVYFKTWRFCLNCTYIQILSHKCVAN